MPQVGFEPTIPLFERAKPVTSPSLPIISITKGSAPLTHNPTMTSNIENIQHAESKNLY
jgi:hypothetical protein